MFTKVFSLFVALVAAFALLSAPSAAIAKAQQGTTIDVSTRAAVITYLRSIHINPRGVVIQRGVQNYAGATVPAGAGRAHDHTSGRAGRAGRREEHVPVLDGELRRRSGREPP